MNTVTDAIMALKTANKRQLTRSVGSFRVEVEILQSLNHPNIIKVFEIIDDPNSQEVYFVIEFVEGGSVASVDSQGHIDRRFTEAESRKLMIQAPTPSPWTSPARPCPRWVRWGELCVACRHSRDTTRPMPSMPPC